MVVVFKAIKEASEGISARKRNEKKKKKKKKNDPILEEFPERCLLHSSV